MRRTIFIEGSVFTILSFLGLAEGFRLLMEPHSANISYDIVGPGSYILAFSFGLFVVGVIHVITNYRKARAVNKTMDKTPAEKQMRMRMFTTIAAFALYAFLINIVGYLVATIVYFILQFRIEGIKSWLHNVILTLVLSGGLYLIFVQLCNTIFPRSILFKYIFGY